MRIHKSTHIKWTYLECSSKDANEQKTAGLWLTLNWLLRNKQFNPRFVHYWSAFCFCDPNHKQKYVPYVTLILGT